MINILKFFSLYSKFLGFVRKISNIYPISLISLLVKPDKLVDKKDGYLETYYFLCNIT